MNVSVSLLCVSFLAAGALSAQTVALDAHTPDTLLQSAAASYNAGAYMRVIDLLQPSGGTSGTPKANYYLGSSFAAVNDPQNAVRYLRMAADSAPGEIAYRFGLARSLSALGSSADARLQYRRILSQDSAFLPALSGLGTMCFDGREYAAAADLFAKAVRINARDYLGYYNLAASLVNLGHPDSAVQFLRAGMALNLRFVPCQSLLASLYYKRKEYQDAERLYGMIVARDSLSPEYWARRGNCLEKLEDWKRAVDCFRRAANYDTANSSYYSRLGQAFFELNRFDSAAVAYTRAAVLEGENPILYLNAGLSYARLDSLDKALQAFHGSLVATHLERLGFLYSQMGGVYYTHKQFTRAVRAYRNALQYDPGNKRVVFFLARSNDESKDFKGAAASYGRFLKLAANDTTASDLVRYARKRYRTLTRTP